MTRLVYFSDVVTDKNQLEIISDDQIIRKGLIFYAGDHTDSKQRHHKFPEDRVYEIVENTNRLLEEGQSIPVLKDHNKTVDAAVGHIESPLEIRRITSQDLPNPKMIKLVGKLGVFCDGIVLKGKDVVSKFMSGAVKTVSPGIDVMTNTLRELSLTPVPAIAGLSLYSQGQSANFALTFDELEQEGNELDAAQEEFEQLSEKFWSLIVNINSASEEELTQMGTDPESLANQAIDDYVARIQELIGMGSENDQQSMQPMQQGGSIAPQQYGRQQPPMQQLPMKPPMNRGRGQFNNDAPLAAYSMADMQSIAEFGYRQAISSSINMLRSGKSMSDIGNNLGRKVLNATKGKIAAVGRLINRVRNVRSGGKLTKNQRIQAAPYRRAGGALAKADSVAPSSVPANPQSVRIYPQPVRRASSAASSRLPATRQSRLIAGRNNRRALPPGVRGGALAKTNY